MASWKTFWTFMVYVYVDGAVSVYTSDIMGEETSYITAMVCSRSNMLDGIFDC